MNETHNIRYLRRAEIDIAKWDQCVDLAPNGLIYAYSFYLDYMAKHWDALVMNDYEAVMPLTWNKKWSIKYLYQPPFTQQLGVFAKSTIDASLMQKFLNRANRHFLFAEIFLNYGNPVVPASVKKNNFILSLDKEYSAIRQLYKKDMLKNLKHAGQFSLNYVKDFDLETALITYRQKYGRRTPHLSRKDYERFERLCFYLREKKLIILRAACIDEFPLAIALFLKKKNRMYLIQSTTSDEGRKMEANHFLLDHIIKEFAGNDVILDFEGSDIPGIAHFYENFGGTNQSYFFYRHNALPWPVKYLKN